MSANVLYRCECCSAAYRVADASRLNFWCCGQELLRTESQNSPSVRGDPNTNDDALRSFEHETIRDNDAILARLWRTSWRRVMPEELTVIEVVPPRINNVDALQAETLLGSLLGSDIFSLEIAADSQGCRFLIRAPHARMKHIQSQIQAVYEQAQFIPLSDEHDPAQLAEPYIAEGRMHLRRSVQLPLRTYRDGDFAESDPIRSLLGAFGRIEAGERVLAQLVHAPAPIDWSDRYQGSTRHIDEAISGEAPKTQNGFDHIVSGISFVFILGLGLWAFTAFMQQNWLSLIGAVVFFVSALVGAMVLYNLLARDRNMDPLLIQRKISVPAFDVSLRLTAAAVDQVTAQTRLDNLMHAYGQYNLASGNALEGTREVFDPRVLEVEQWSWWQEFTGSVMRLNITEIASMWHLPTGEAVPLVARHLSKKLLPPRPELLASGVLIGRSIHHGRDIPVHLPYEVLDRHSFIVAKTQQGKSTLMAHLARAAMEQDMAVVVIDPHGDLARALSGMVPPSKVDKTIYLDFSDEHRIVGINLLDMGQGRPPYAVIENLVHVGKLIWQDYWGPRMEDALRYVMRTLIEANEKLCAMGEKQFTLLDISNLIGFDEFRRKLLSRFVRKNDVLQWWGVHYEQMPQHMRVEVVNPVLTKIHRFEEHDVIRRIVGQSSSTINLRDVLSERKILLVNTANRIIGPDAGGLLGSILLDNINFAIGEQMRVADPSKRTKVLVVIDEFQSLPGVDYPALLAELQKMGASFVLATQALRQLDELGATLRASILSNISTLFVFQTSAEDADTLRHELDEEVEATDVINLERHSCYVKTVIGKTRLPIVHVETAKPAHEDEEVAAKIRERVSHYTRPVNEVEHERNTFWNFWYGREMIIIKGYLLGGGSNGSRRSGGSERNNVLATSVAAPTTGANSSQETRNDTKTTDAPSSGAATAPKPETGNPVVLEEADSSATARTADDLFAAGDVSGEPIEKVVGKGGPKRGQVSQGGVT